MTDSYDLDDISREVIKCVVVGDSAVGKTRLICARACDQKVGLEQLLTVHTPTVWAIDSYRISREILDKSFQSVDNVPVSLRLWDTFGDHNNDRRFAYGRSDVVLLCFSVLNRRSLHHAKTVWYPEIKRMCPGAPVILVGCKNDLRHLCLQSWFQKLVAERRPFGKPILPADVVFPEQGRMVAKEIGSPYYETSVLTFFGIQDLFANVIRAALCRRRQVRFWMTTLDTVRLPLLQAPYLPPRPTSPEIQIAQSYYRDHLLHSAAYLLQAPSCASDTAGTGFAKMCSNEENGPFYDCVLEIAQASGAKAVMNRIRCHKLILASASEVWRTILVCTVPSCVYCSQIVDNGSSGNNNEFEEDTCQLLPVNSCTSSPEKDKQCADFHGNISKDMLAERTSACYTGRFQKDKALTIEMATEESSTSKLTVIRIKCAERELSGEIIGSLLYFFYTGQIPKRLSESRKKTLFWLARQWKVPLVEECPESAVEDEYLAEMIRSQFLEERNENIVRLAAQELFSDSKFILDSGVSVGANRFLLASRCAVMEAMFSDRFREGLASQVKLPAVSLSALTKLLVYLYTDNITVDHAKVCTSTDLFEVLEIANRLCQLRLVNLLEVALVTEYTSLIAQKHFGDEGVILEEVLSVLEGAQMYNANQLANWCLNFLCCNYNRACKQHPKLVKNLSQANQDFLARNRWPPIWYLKEFDWYERSLRDRQKSEQLNEEVGGSTSARLKRARTRSGCLCFSKASRNQTESVSLE